jgi:hypothetical protein
MIFNSGIFNQHLRTCLQDPELKNIVIDTLGYHTPEKIEHLVLTALIPYLTSNIEKLLFIEPSAGVVFGFLLASGRKIVLKVFNRNITYRYLERMTKIQKLFYDEDFPAPEVLSPIFKLNISHAGLYSFIEGRKENAHFPRIREELAKYLAKFSEIVDRHQFELLYTFMQLSTKGKLWPDPHNVLFDLKKSQRGAGWIAKKAREAKKILSASPYPKRLAHTDWDVKNTLFKDEKLVGVFDWDSLGTLSEPEMVGRAAAQFTADWESGNKVTPTPEEGRKFVAAYEKFRGRKFSSREYQVISASADFLIALIARFEHAGSQPTVHPYQDLLKECGNKSFLYT